MKNSNLIYLDKAIQFGRPPSRNDRVLFEEEIARWGLAKHYARCCICDWNKSSIDWAHVRRHCDGGFYTLDNIVPLCPNHHRQFDLDDLTTWETESIQGFLWRVMNVVSPW